MSDEQYPTTDGTAKADRCARRTACRRAAGEVFSEVSLLAEHPDLMPELAEELRKRRLVEAARQQAAGGLAGHAASRPTGRIMIRTPAPGNWRSAAQAATRRWKSPSIHAHRPHLHACGSHFSLVDQSRRHAMAPPLSEARPV